MVMKKLQGQGVFLLLILLMVQACIAENNTQALTAAAEILKVYPQFDGLSRHVLEVPDREDEALARVRIIAGKMTLVDCNHIVLPGELKQETIQGWGYSYYRFYKTDAVSLSTAMACPGVEPNLQFVPISEVQVQYNSLLPLVVYLPEGYEVKFELWEQSEELLAEQK